MEEVGKNRQPEINSLFYSLDTDILKQECEMRNTKCILGYLTVPSPHHGHIGLAASPTRKKHSEHAHKGCPPNH